MTIPASKQVHFSDVPRKYHRTLKDVERYVEKMRRATRQVITRVQLYRQDWQGIEDALPEGVSLTSHRFAGVWLDLGDAR